MKTHLELKHLVTTSFAAFAAVLFLGCGAQQSADSGSFASQAVLSITPSSTVVALSSQVQIAVSGGVAPYTFKIISGLGSVYASGNTGIYTAPASGTGLVQIQVTDSAGAVAIGGLSLSGTAIIVTPQNQTLGLGSSVSMTVTGGTPPYYYSVGTAGGGSFSTTGATTGSNTFTAGTTSETVLINVTDSSSPANTNSTYIDVSGLAGSSATSCAGTFTMVENNQAGTMYIGIINAATNQITGSIMLNNGTQQSFSGNCTATAISFTVNGSAYFTATLNVSANNPGHIFFTGGIYQTSGGTYSWSAND